MNPLVPRLLHHAPAFVRRAALLLLFRATASAFGREMPRLAGLSREACLAEYARCSAAWAGATLLDREDLSGVQARLHANAYRLGRTVGRLLGVGTSADVMALARFLYTILDIEFEGSGTGDIAIRRCYFSTFYSPEVCRLMSAMDRGLLCGLAGGGDLAFSQRITEGQPCCRARFWRGAAT